MELTVQEESTQPVFSRRRLQLEITFEHAVPARGILAQQLAQKQDVPIETVAIRTIRSRFGGGTARVEAFVYESADALAKYEQAHIVKRTEKTLAQPAAEEEPAEAAEEAPAEEAKEAPEATKEASEDAPEAEADDADSEKKE